MSVLIYLSYEYRYYVSNVVTNYEIEMVHRK